MAQRDPSQPRDPAHGRDRAPAHLLDRDHGRPELPRLRHPAAGAELGPHDQREPDRPGVEPVGSRRSGDAHRPVDHRHEHLHRCHRPGRRSGSSVGRSSRCSGARPRYRWRRDRRAADRDRRRSSPPTGARSGSRSRDLRICLERRRGSRRGRRGELRRRGRRGARTRRRVGLRQDDRRPGAARTRPSRTDDRVGLDPARRDGPAEPVPPGDARRCEA